MVGHQAALRRARWAGFVAVVTVMSVLAATVGQAPAVAARPTPAKPPAVDPGPAVRGVKALPSHFARPVESARPYAPTATVWPAASTVSVPVAAPVGGARLGAVSHPATSPVSVRAVAGTNGGYGGPAKVGVRVLEHAAAVSAGVNGVLLYVAAAAVGTGTVQVGVDYSGFAQAYGGNFGQRLRLVALPACALSTPQVASCRTATQLGSVNDQSGHTVSAQVSLSSPPPAAAGRAGASASAVAQVVLAAVSDAGSEGGSAGSYAATTLKPSGSWAGGSSTGSFTYSYPVAVPPAASSLVPTVALSYDSGSVDGQTSSTQAQSSWVGDGWSTPASFVEQSFTSCADSPEGSASPVSTQDECYDGPVLSLSLGGSSSSLVWDATRQVWKPEQDSGEVVAHVTGSGNGTGTYNTDYWTVTERDGTVYQFGRNQLPGWASGKATTNSVDSMPVYSAHSGDPCYNAAGFTSSVCTMGYRWNLDYVKDVHGNAMAYYYKQSTNFYGEDNGAHNVSYVRDSYLDHVDYGFTDGNAYGTVPNKVVYTAGSRCVSGICDPLSAATKANWPDVPYDLVCASGSTCSSYGPSFFSTVRLTAITAQQYSTASAAYASVDSYALTQTTPATGDGTSPTLWLSSITHTGSDTTAGGSTAPITLPPVTFTSIDLQNRVDATPAAGLPGLYRFRVATVTTETGSVISATYGQPAACAAPVTLTPSSNTSSCYPVYWTPAGYTVPYLDWFNKYVVTKVTQTDPTGGAAATATSYLYQGGAAWHYDDNEVVKAKYRTYGQFRGYATVQTLTGDGVNDPQTLSQATFYRGMSRNNNSTAVTVTDSAGGVHDDTDQLAGNVLEATAYLGNGGPVDHSTITSYWVSAATATRARTGLDALTANWVAPAETYTRQAVTSGATSTWRYTETDNTYDATVTDTNVGALALSYTHTVPVNAAYDRCTSITLAAANTTANLVGLVAASETDSVACGGYTAGSPASVPGSLNTLTAPATVNRPAQVVSRTRTYFDDATFSTTFPQAAAPAKGDVTMVSNAADYVSGAFTYLVAKRAVYDTYGRVTTSYDANGNATTTGYTQNSVGLTTATTVTNPLGQASSTTVDTERGLGLTATDANGVVTTQQYDALGRITSIWLNSRATTTAANYLFTYTVSNSGITAATTQKLAEIGAYLTSTLIYDGLLRPRQTQTQTPQSGRMVTDTFYDTRGWTTATYNGWWDSATTPNTTLVSAANLHDSVPSQDFYTYDGLGRPVVDASDKDGVVVSTTTTVYNGDRTTVIPPTGGVTTATLADPFGRTTELDQYTTAPTLTTPANTFTGIWSLTGGTTTATTYGYDGHGNQATVTDAQTHTWTSTFNLLGQATSKADPDAGTSTLAYDNNANLTQATDSRGKTVSYTYDPLNRKTGRYAATVAAQSASNMLASWVYDNSNTAVSAMTNPIGHLTTSTAYWGGAAYTTQANGFNVFGEPTGETITIPASTEGSVLGTTYTFSHVYYATNGLPFKDTSPAAGGLPAETNVHTYTVMDQPNALSAGYAQKTDYDAFGRVMQETIGGTAGLAYITNSYDDHTGRLTDQLVTRATTTPANVDEQAYSYDLAGNITKQISTRLGAATPTETQCYTYDTLDRLAAAWTATDSCAATPTTASHTTVGDSLGTASAYWTTWTHDVLGQRTNQTRHTLTTGTDTATSYTYNTNQPNTLAATATSGGNTATTSYSYDTTGNTTTRATPDQGSQTLTWNDAGQLTAVTGSTAGNTSYIYDADGNLLLQKDPGTTTLYLPGEQITLNTTAGTTTGVRYHPLPGGGTVIRTGTGTNYGFEITDQHGTPTVYLDNTAQTPTWRQYTPYGEPRGTTTTAPDNRGFLNRPLNTTTGLTEIGARNYDPTLGRFISPDPILDTTDPQQLNGYTYAAENPITRSDPTGLKAACGPGFDIPCGSYDNHPKLGSPSGNTSGSSGDGGGGGSSKCMMKGCGAGQSIQDQSTKTLCGRSGCYQAVDRPTATSGCGKILCGNVCTDGGSLKCEKEGLWYGIMLLTAVGSGALDLILLVDPPAERVALGAEAGLLRWEAEEAQAAEIEAAAANAESRAARLACGNSFDQNTPVLLADGTTRPIKQVKIGDQVTATDPETETTTAEPVTALHLNQDTDLTDITIHTSTSDPAVLHTTQHHPFWNDTHNTWTDAADLHPGDKLRTTIGEQVTVTAVRSLTALHPMYNLTINHAHTYYVMAGNMPVLVHNTPCRTFGFPDVPKVPGVYTITMKDGKVYVGSSASDVHARIHAAFTSAEAAVFQKGYKPSDIANISVNDMSGFSRNVIRGQEQSVMDQYGGISGGTLLNRRNEVP
jgi:RHS repeat-associated protein